jgi:hypothetical protein
MKPEDIKLGYLMITSPIPNVYIGGAMITDGRGLPVEFRYTDPIQPTKIQQILYGQVLSRYIKREVILETLLKNIESKFKYLLVEDEHLLSYPSKGFTMIRVSETKSAPLGGVGKLQEISPTEILLQASKDGSPLRIHLEESTPSPPSAAPSTPNDPSSSATTATPSGASASPSGSFDALIAAGHHMDVYEPMKRIEKALEIICQEEGISSPSK